MLAAAARGLGVLPVLQGTPAWAALQPGDPASPPRDPEDFARLLTALVARYGPNGSLWAEHPEASRAARPRVADLERAEPHALLERRALGAVLRDAAQARQHGAEGRRPGRQDDSRGPAERELGGGRGDLRGRRARLVRRRHAAPLHGPPEERRQDREDRPARDGPPRRPQAARSGSPSSRGPPRRARRRSTAASRPPRRVSPSVSRTGCRCSSRAPTRCGSGASTGTRGCRPKASRTAHSTSPGCGGCATAGCVSAPSLAVFTRLARRLQGCAKQPGDARRCR